MNKVQFNGSITFHLETFFIHSLLLILFVFGTHRASAWIYPEHRQIALLAIQKLSPADRAALEKLWMEGRIGYSERLTEFVIDPEQGIEPRQLDFASWAGIAGDHSCSPDIMLQTVLKSGWILRVADIAAKLKINIEKAKNNSQRVNALRDSDIKLQRADQEYATRAGSNNVHFLLPRPEAAVNAKQYGAACLTPGAELNAVAAYTWFHNSAMIKAARYANVKLSAEEKSMLILSAFADEAFALHFLQDVYAAGHTTGSWGNASVRKGTHDYYNEKGLEIATWDGKRMISLGDAYMRQQDAEFAADAVQLSLEQLIKAATGQSVLDYKNDAYSVANTPDTLNVCKNNFVPTRKKASTTSEVDKMSNYDFIPEVLVKTPVPGLSTGLGEMPRFRSELGLFMGVSSSLNGSSVSGGFGKDQTKVGGVGGIEANVRVGLGLDGVLNQAGDGLVFLQFGWRQDASSTNQFSDSYGSTPAGSITAAIPGRQAFNVRFRVPFWLIPGDLIIAGPILLLVSPKSLQKMAVTAGNGGVIPWQSGIATPIGRFQFVLGREVGISMYGTTTPQNDALLIQNSTTSDLQLISYSSVKFDFPFLEYRPLRGFSMNQSSSLILQLSAGFDVPHSPTVLSPIGSSTPDLKTVSNLTLRIIFDWRHYF